VKNWKQERKWLTHLARTNTTYYDQVKKDFERAWFRKFELLLDGATVGPAWLKDERVRQESLRACTIETEKLTAWTHLL
jgi:hypothetical protein